MLTKEAVISILYDFVDAANGDYVTRLGESLSTSLMVHRSLAVNITPGTTNEYSASAVGEQL